MSSEFIQELHLSSQQPLKDADQKGRQICPQCKKSMKYFCYQCRIPLIENIPKIDLPIDCEIIHHPTEKVSKSTALSATLLSDSCHWIEFPSDLPNYNPNETLLLFPSPTAKKVADFSPDSLRQIKRVVCIESVWQKANVVVNHPKIQHLPRAVISSHDTIFWRYQNISTTCLSSIEAIYYFYKEYAMVMNGSYNGEYDDLLFFFTHIYRRVQDYYNENPDKTFLHKDNYIQYKDEEVMKKKEEEAKSGMKKMYKKKDLK